MFIFDIVICSFERLLRVFAAIAAFSELVIGRFENRDSAAWLRFRARVPFRFDKAGLTMSTARAFQTRQIHRRQKNNPGWLSIYTPITI